MKNVQAGFPGRTVTGVCLALAPLVAVAGALIEMPSYHALGTDFVAGMVAHSTAFTTGAQLAQAAMIMMILAVCGLTGMSATTHPKLARGAGVLTVIGLCGPISFESLYWGAWHLTDTAEHRAAAAQMLDESQIIPRTIMNVTGPCLVVGFVLLAIAAARSGLLDRASAICLGATCVIPLGFIAGYLAISAAGFALTAVAVVPLGVRLLRGGPDSNPAQGGRDAGRADPGIDAKEAA